MIEMRHAGRKAKIFLLTSAFAGMVCAIVVAWKFRRRLPFVRCCRRVHRASAAPIRETVQRKTSRMSVAEKTKIAFKAPAIHPKKDTSLPLLDISDYDVHVITNSKQCYKFFSTLPHPLKVVGLDCEWVSFQKSRRQIPVALLQLAFTNRTCALLRLTEIKSVSPVLRDIMTDKSILKCGVGIYGDITRIQRQLKIGARGVVDLRLVAHRLGIRRGLSLNGLTQRMLGASLDKCRSVTCSDWETPELTDRQIRYAASDAIAGLRIFEKMVEVKLSEEAACQDLPESDGAPVVSQASLGSILASSEGVECSLSLCKGIVDVSLKDAKANLVSSSHNSLVPRRSYAYSARSQPLYDNCQLKAPDGTLLASVDRKKMNWYLERNLAVAESNNTVRLLFEPAAKPKEDRRYYLTVKDNACVVCGAKENYIRKSVVPHEYRRHFPTLSKNHLSHDVLLLCVSCHQLSSFHDSCLRQALAKEYSAPLEANTARFHNDPQKVKVRKFAYALVTAKNLPDARRKEMEETIAEYCDCKVHELTKERIETLSTVETRSVNKDYISHGELVVSQVLANGHLVEFQKRWRQHFLNTMQPRFLPRFWDVNHNPKTTT